MLGEILIAILTLPETLKVEKLIVRFMEIFLKEIAGEWEVLVFSELPLPGEPVPQKAGGEFRTIYFIENRGGLMISSRKVGGQPE